MNLRIASTEVHVWHIPLNAASIAAEHFSHVLSKDEMDRAARFHFARDRDRFLVARGSLRLLLATYVRQSPETLIFRHGPQGKPELVADNCDMPVFFNLSHSHEVGVVAIARGRQVGVDVEKITPHSPDHISVAEQFFTPAEADLIRSAAAQMRADVFFRLWTRKEAFLKGCGDGLSGSLSQFEVSLEKPEIRFAENGKCKRRNWSVREFRPGPGYVGAVASEGEEWEVHLWQFEGRPRKGAKPPSGDHPMRRASHEPQS